MLTYARFLLRQHVKSERGTAMIEYVFVVAAVVAIGVLLFSDGDTGLGATLKTKFDNAIGKIKNN